MPTFAIVPTHKDALEILESKLDYHWQQTEWVAPEKWYE